MGRAEYETVVSVVTPAYNCAEALPLAVESVRNQTLREWEHVIVDDGSSDDTSSVIATCEQQDARVRQVRLDRNSGAAVARNAGIAQARGRFIAFLDSDDRWDSEKLELQVQYMISTGVGLSYTNYERIDARSGRSLGNVISPARVTREDLLRSNQIACSTAMYDLAMLGKVYMPLIRKRQDWGLWLEITRRGFAGYNVNRVLGRYYVRPGSVSSNKVMALVYTWRFFRDVAEIPLARRIARIFGYVLVNSKKYSRAKRDTKS